MLMLSFGAAHDCGGVAGLATGPADWHCLRRLGSEVPSMRGAFHLIAALTLLVLSGCATIDTGSFVDREVDFTRFSTYTWAPPSQQTGDPRLLKNPSFQDHLQGEVDKQLASKGFRNASRRNADLLLRYRAAVAPRLAVNGVSNGYGYCSNDCSQRVDEYDSATLVLDVINARTKKIVWRGWATDNLDQLLGNEDRMARTLNHAVVEMMAKFPSRG